jgi:LysM domain
MSLLIILIIFEMINNKTFVNYITKQHDSLPSICAKFHSTPYRMRQLNPQVNLDEIKPGQTLLVEITQLRKGSEESPLSPFKQRNQNFDEYPDMTFQRKPLFVQVRQVDYKFIDTDGMEEFQRAAPPKVDYSDLNITLKMDFSTPIGRVPGELTIA